MNRTFGLSTLKGKKNRKTTFAFLQFTYALNNEIMLFEKSHAIL